MYVCMYEGVRKGVCVCLCVCVCVCVHARACIRTYVCMDG